MISKPEISIDERARQDQVRALQARDKALDIHQCIKRHVYLQQQGLRVKLTVSMGVAVYPAQARDAGELLAFADDALFTMKAEGRDGVRVYSLS